MYGLFMLFPLWPNQIYHSMMKLLCSWIRNFA